MSYTGKFQKKKLISKLSLLTGYKYNYEYALSIC